MVKKVIMFLTIAMSICITGCGTKETVADMENTESEVDTEIQMSDGMEEVSEETETTETSEVASRNHGDIDFDLYYDDYVDIFREWFPIEYFSEEDFGMEYEEYLMSRVDEIEESLQGFDVQIGENGEVMIYDVTSPDPREIDYYTDYGQEYFQRYDDAWLNAIKLAGWRQYEDYVEYVRSEGADGVCAGLWEYFRGQSAGDSDSYCVNPITKEVYTLGTILPNGVVFEGLAYKFDSDGQTYYETDIGGCLYTIRYGEYDPEGITVAEDFMDWLDAHGYLTEDLKTGDYYQGWLKYKENK